MMTMMLTFLLCSVFVDIDVAAATVVAVGATVAFIVHEVLWYSRESYCCFVGLLQSGDFL